jgi:hypothetical protein
VTSAQAESIRRTLASEASVVSVIRLR